MDTCHVRRSTNRFESMVNLKMKLLFYHYILFFNLTVGTKKIKSKREFSSCQSNVSRTGAHLKMSKKIFMTPPPPPLPLLLLLLLLLRCNNSMIVSLLPFFSNFCLSDQVPIRLLGNLSSFNIFLLAELVNRLSIDLIGEFEPTISDWK